MAKIQRGIHQKETQKAEYSSLGSTNSYVWDPYLFAYRRNQLLWIRRSAISRDVIDSMNIMVSRQTLSRYHVIMELKQPEKLNIMCLLSILSAEDTKLLEKRIWDGKKKKFWIAHFREVGHSKHYFRVISANSEEEAFIKLIRANIDVFRCMLYDYVTGSMHRSVHRCKIVDKIESVWLMEIRYLVRILVFWHHNSNSEEREEHHNKIMTLRALFTDEELIDLVKEATKPEGNFFVPTLIKIDDNIIIE